jgi:pimeloyl-ACP methyl ester carboxylesterase
MTLAYDVAGSGPGLLLLHSGISDRRMWDPQWEALATAGFRVVRCDFRGFGESPAPSAPYNEAEDVAEVLDAAGLDSAAVVGSSYGGRVAQEVAARWPERVSKLVLVCSSSADLEPGPALGELWRQEEVRIEAGEIDAAVDLNLAAFLGPEASAAAREHLREMQRHSFDVQLAAGDEYPPTDVPFSLSSITAPSLVISGAKDLPEFRELARRLTDTLSEARAVELPWAGHLPTLERPQELTALLTEFLRDQS